MVLFLYKEKRSCIFTAPFEFALFVFYFSVVTAFEERNQLHNKIYKEFYIIGITHKRRSSLSESLQ